MLSFCVCAWLMSHTDLQLLFLISFILLFSETNLETQQPAKTHLVRTTILDILNFLHLLKNILCLFFASSYSLNQCPVLHSVGPCVTAQVSHPWSWLAQEERKISQCVTLLPQLEHFLLFPTCWIEWGAENKGIYLYKQDILMIHGQRKKKDM